MGAVSQHIPSLELRSVFWSNKTNATPKSTMNPMQGSLKLQTLLFVSLFFAHTGSAVRKREVPQPTPLVLPFRKENMPADTPLLTWSQLSSQHSPQLPVQRLNHSCKAPAGLVQVQVAGPQALAHGLLAGETDEGSVSVRACWSEGAGGSGGLLQAPLPEPPT